MKFPVIDNRATGVNLRRIMDARNIAVKDLKEYLGLSSIQSIYHWLNGICLPSIDNLYAMSIYFRLPMDALICGSHNIICRKILILWEHFAAAPHPDHFEIQTSFHSDKISS